MYKCHECHECGGPMPDDTDILCAECNFNAGERNMMFTLTTSQVRELNAAADAVESAVGGPVEDLSFNFVGYRVSRVTHNGWKVDSL